MANILTIYILIGLAHGASHALGCRACMSALGVIVSFFLEQMAHVCGWPIFMVKYLRLWNHPDGTSTEDIERALSKMAEKRGLQGFTIDAEPVDGESDVQYYARIEAAVSDKLRQIHEEEMQRKARGNQ